MTTRQLALVAGESYVAIFFITTFANFVVLASLLSAPLFIALVL